MKDPAQFEKYFNRCPSCNGLGFEGGQLGESQNLCTSCRGSGMTLTFQGGEVALTLPLFVDYIGRAKAQVYRFILLLLAAAFMIGVPYIIYIYVAEFFKNLNAL